MTPMEQRLAELWAELHAAQDHAALLQAPSTAAAGAGSITYAALHQWIREVQAVVAVRSERQPSNTDALGNEQEQIVVAIAVAPCSVEETALLLMVAEQSHWVYVPVDERLPLPQQIRVLNLSRANRLVTLPSSPLAQFFGSRDPKSEGAVGAVPKWMVASSSSPFHPVQVFSIPLPPLQSSAPTAKYLESKSDFPASSDAVSDGLTPFYVLFTSGSTGVPRGVVGTRLGAWSRLQWMWQAHPFARSSYGGAQECVLRATRLSFVDSVWEVLGAFLQRVPLVHVQSPRRQMNEDAGSEAAQTLVRSVVLDDSTRFLETVKKFGVTRFTAVPSVLEMLLLQTQMTDRRAAFATLRYILSSGETLSWGLAHQLTSELPHVTVLNLYGSTEVSGDVTCMELKAPLAPQLTDLWRQYGVPIGSLSSGGVVGDESMSLMLVPDDTAEYETHSDHLESESASTIWPPNASGKQKSLLSAQKAPIKGVLYVSGPLVALGYVGDDQDEERGVFMNHCSLADGQKAESEGGSDAPSRQRWVCTGDICLAAEGQLHFCGRKDNAVKIRGQRVHLEAVERIVAAALIEISGSGPGSDESDKDAPLWQQCKCQPIALATRTATSKRALEQTSVVVFLVLNDTGTMRFTNEKREERDQGPRPRGSDDAISIYTEKLSLYSWIEQRYGAAYVPSEALTVHRSALRQMPQGKIDRRALEVLYSQYTAQLWGQPNARREAESKVDGEERPEVRLLTRLLFEILGIRSADGGLGDTRSRTFMELGGNSLLATLLRYELQQECGRFAVTAQDLLPMRIEGILAALSSSVREATEQTANPRPRSPESSITDSKYAYGGTSKRRKTTEVVCLDAERSGDLAHSNVSSADRLTFLSRYNQSSKAHTGPWIPKCYATVTDQLPQDAVTGHRQLGLRCAWGVNLGKCIDASPFVVQRHDTCGDVISTWAIVGSHSSVLVCVDVEADGKEVWRTKLDDRIEACAALSVKQETVYVGTYAGTFYALELSSGKPKWHMRAGATIKASALVIDSHGLVICGAYDHKVYGLDTATGAKKWTVNLGGSIFSTPVYLPSSTQLFAASTSGRVMSLELSAASSDSVSTQWTFQLSSPVFAGLNVDSASQILVVACADGKLYGLATASGEPQWELATGKPIFSSPCVYRTGELIVGSHDGVLRKVDCKNGQLIWATDLQSAIFASPTVVKLAATPNESLCASTRTCESSERDKKLLLCSVATIAGRVYFCEEESGSVLFQTEHSSGRTKQDSTASESDRDLGPLFASPVIVGKWCLLGTRINHLFGLELVYSSTSRMVYP